MMDAATRLIPAELQMECHNIPALVELSHWNGVLSWSLLSIGDSMAKSIMPIYSLL
jgi:hypothetical protein